MSFVGGKLKLKGGVDLSSAGGVKKKKKKVSDDKAEANNSQALQEASSPRETEPAGATGSGSKSIDLKKVLHGYEIQPQDDNVDRRTEAEKRFERHQLKLEQERLKKAAGKSHRDRIKEFNDYLGNLSEHHDIPRVGPG